MGKLTLPGTPIPDGFTRRDVEPMSQEALARVQAKIEAVNEARLRALADMRGSVVG